MVLQKLARSIGKKASKEAREELVSAAIGGAVKGGLTSGIKPNSGAAKKRVARKLVRKGASGTYNGKAKSKQRRY